VDQPERYRRFSGAVFSGTHSRSFVCNAVQHEAIMSVHFSNTAGIHVCKVDFNIGRSRSK
jgi:hypothetical protein